jgi:hypothetical protein
MVDLFKAVELLDEAPVPTHGRKLWLAEGATLDDLIKLLKEEVVWHPIDTKECFTKKNK